jgi:hypothetical protein
MIALLTTAARAVLAAIHPAEDRPGFNERTPLV